MASFNKFENWVKAICEKEVDCDTDTFKIYLSNATPSASADLVKTDLAEITNQNGYTAPATVPGTNTSDQTGGVYSLLATGDVSWTASGGSFGPFQYVVLYDDTHASDALVGWWDYGSAISVNTGETFTVDLSTTIFTVT